MPQERAHSIIHTGDEREDSDKLPKLRVFDGNADYYLALRLLSYP